MQYEQGGHCGRSPFDSDQTEFYDQRHGASRTGEHSWLFQGRHSLPYDKKSIIPVKYFSKYISPEPLYSLNVHYRPGYPTVSVCTTDVIHKTSNVVKL